MTLKKSDDLFWPSGYIFLQRNGQEPRFGINYQGLVIVWKSPDWTLSEKDDLIWPLKYFWKIWVKSGICQKLPQMASFGHKNVKMGQNLMF